MIEWLLNHFILAITAKFSSPPEGSTENIYELIRNRKNTRLDLRIYESVICIPELFFSEEHLEVKVE
jgi:hypothetical protein